MFSQHRIFVLILSVLYLTSGIFKVTNGNSIFRFGFNFGLSVNENTFQTSFNVGDVEEEESKNYINDSSSENITLLSTTTDSPTLSPLMPAPSSPILTDIWSKQAQLNATANDKLQASRLAVTQLNQEISTVVGRSDFIAAKVKLMTRYLNKANAVTITAGNDAAAAAAASNRFLILQDYVQLVDDLLVPPTNEQGGERSLEYMVMKLGLEKYKLIELQTQILVEVLQVMEMWQNYVKTQLIDVATV